MLYQYILLYSQSTTLISIFLFNVAVAGAPIYMIGPVLYWYVRSVLTDDSKLKQRDLWHFLPMAIYFVTALPTAFLPWYEKVELAGKTAADAAFIGQYQATLLTRIFPQVWVFASRLILILVYTLWAIYIFVTYQRKNRITAVFSKQVFMKKWLYCLLGFVFVLVTTQIPLVIKSFELHFTEYYFTLKIIQAISATGLIGLLVSPFFFPSILYGLPRVPLQKRPSASSARGEQKKQTSPRPKNHLFETEYLKTIEMQAISAMKELRPYLSSDCNLFSFSKLINVPAHHLAYYFREVKGQHFNDFRNEWRINHAKTLIKEGRSSEITLEAIGMLSGFSSRNAFIADFKKSQGVSPGAYASRYN